MGRKTEEHKETDRRLKSRFSMRRELRYKVLHDGEILEIGSGYTLNIGSGGIAFAIDGTLSPGAFIELSISWPVQLENGCPMRLIVFGRVLRSMPGAAACTMDKYEFRTQARTSLPVPAVRNDSMLLRWANGRTHRSTGVPGPELPRPMTISVAARYGQSQ